MYVCVCARARARVCVCARARARVCVYNVGVRVRERAWMGVCRRSICNETCISRLESNKFNMAEHTGTHVDAPSHFAKDHWRMQQVPPSRLIGPGVVIDVTEKVNGNPDYGITVQDLQVSVLLGVYWMNVVDLPVYYSMRA